MRRPLRPAVALAVAGVLAAEGAPRAGEWHGEAGVSEQLSYDDNIGLTTASPTSAWGSTTMPNLTLTYTVDPLDLELHTRLDFTRYPSEPGLNSNDQQAQVSASYDLPRSHLTLAGEVLRNTSRSSELDDTGRAILDNIRRRSTRLQPGWTYRATSLDSFSLNADVQDVSFASDALTGFRQYRGQATWGHALSRTTSIGGSLLGSRFEPDAGRRPATDSLAAQAEIAHAALPRWQARLAAGIRYTRAEGGAAPADDSGSAGFLLDGSTTYRPNARTALTGSIRRALEPSAGGELVQRDAVSLSLGYRWTRSISLALGLGYQHQESAGGDDERLQAMRSSFRVVPNLSWQLARRWGLSLSYAYRRQDLDNGGTRSGDAVSNAVNLGLTYETGAWSAPF